MRSNKKRSLRDSCNKKVRRRKRGCFFTFLKDANFGAYIAFPRLNSSFFLSFFLKNGSVLIAHTENDKGKQEVDEGRKKRSNIVCMREREAAQKSFLP